ncbi:MAG: hypothetical protein JXA54_14315 [Candidatus Heimdallarchaeota archaeon]|nr:hypothetical protein [Candidatus Heimdallarchaeota archaeon]
MGLRIAKYFLKSNLDFLDNLRDLPNNISRIMSNAIAILIVLCFILGVIFSIIGIVKWVTGRDDKGGKKSMIRGVILIIFSLVGGSIGVTLVPFS